MEAAERQISQILTEKLRYEIPPYQRPYAWEASNVEQFLSDVNDARLAGDEEYFIGSLITIAKTKGELYEVVDGQQRLTTLNLIFARLRKHTEDTYAKADLENRVRLPKLNATDASLPRLNIRKKDQAFFVKYVLDAADVSNDLFSQLNEDEDTPKLNMIGNIAAIDLFLAGKSQDEIRLFKDFLLTRVYVVVVSTNSLKSAYRLFNVLNARGVQLSNADLIKNKLFGALSNGDGSQELEERWLEIESEIGIESLDQFLGHHRVSIRASKAQQVLHEEYGPLIKESATPFIFMDQLTASGKNFTRIMKYSNEAAGLRRLLASLHRAAFDDWIPPLLAFLNKPVPDLPLVEFVSLLEKITYQNWVRRLGFTARLTVYYKLIAAIQDGKLAADIKAIFAANANNIEFSQFIAGDIYGRPFAKAVLLRLEEYPQDESVTKSYDGTITIEHVLPQKGTDVYWESRFTAEEQKLWIHRLGNLALLSGTKNSQAKHWDFDKKKTFYSRQQSKVSFDLTKEVEAAKDWNLTVLTARQKKLTDLAEKIWSI